MRSRNELACGNNDAWDLTPHDYISPLSQLDVILLERRRGVLGRKTNGMPEGRDVVVEAALLTDEFEVRRFL